MSKVACIPFSSREEAEVFLGPLPAEVEYVFWPSPDAPFPDASLGRITFFAPLNKAGTAGAWVPRVPSMPRLEVLQLGSAGFEHALPVRRPGLAICNAAGVHDAATAETAVLLTLALLRDLPGFQASQNAHQWNWHRTPGLAGKSVLIFGYGRIGAAIEARLAGFEPARVVRVARRPRTDPVVHPASELAELLPQADVVILQCPSTPETDGLFDAGMLALLKDGAVLVNTARGSVVDTGALLAELASGRVSAGLDVVDPEPLPPEHPLWDAPNAIVLPHVGSTTDIEFVHYHRLLRDQVRRYADGEALANVVA
ncbi:NAD(P)-dependent oxidoreductase [Propionicicella superfundia]|uniref:NAD(P)-dependent oxidoreductase n=1 Tax=Propionicicella superfundia TaxID=348582 RepID=UPI0004207E2F|nr:NAD(P)-dependent oxidoreductase [Propionicicella superfundia]